MDSSRSTHRRSSRRDTPSRRATPLSTEEQSRPLRSSTSHQSHHSLPSIRHLHPYLPPSSMSQHIQGSGESASYSYPPPQPGYSVASGSAPSMSQQHELPASHIQGHSEETQRRSGGDSDQEGDDQLGPPKKKRRRQALSCTG